MRGKLQALWMIDAASAGLIGLGVGITPAAAVRGAGPTRPELIGYVTESGTSSLDRLDPVADRLIPPITVGRAPTTMAVAPGGKIAYVVSTDSTVWSVNLLTGKASAITGIGPNPMQVAFSADGRTAYVATDSDLVAVDVASGHVITTLPVTNFPLGPLLEIAPHGHALFMINTDEPGGLAGRVAGLRARHPGRQGAWLAGADQRGQRHRGAPDPAQRAADRASVRQIRTNATAAPYAAARPVAFGELLPLRVLRGCLSPIRRFV